MPLLSSPSSPQRGKRGRGRTVSKKSEILNLIDNYFHWNNCVSAKNKKFGLVKQFYYLSSIGALKASMDSVLGRSFTKFVEQWEATNNPDS